MDTIQLLSQRALLPNYPIRRNTLPRPYWTALQEQHLFTQSQHSERQRFHFLTVWWQWLVTFTPGQTIKFQKTLWKWCLERTVFYLKHESNWKGTKEHQNVRITLSNPGRTLYFQKSQNRTFSLIRQPKIIAQRQLQQKAWPSIVYHLFSPRVWGN